LTSFDVIQIAYHDQAKGPSLILLDGGVVDRLGQLG
jgi:hypothetical protein